MVVIGTGVSASGMQGDNLTISLFLIGTGITLAVSAMGQAGWRHPALTFGLFAFAVLLTGAGVAWPLVRDLSSEWANVVKEVATSPISWFVVIILGITASLLLRRSGRTREPLAPADQKRQLNVWLILAIAVIITQACVITYMGSSLRNPSTAPAHTLGPYATFSILEELKQKAEKLQVPGGWNIIITGPPDSTQVQADLRIIIQKAISQVNFRDWPDGIDLDVPPKPEPPQQSGIVLHGDNALSRALLAFGGCFEMRRTQSIIPSLERYYPSSNLVWIEISKGSPWSGPQICSG